MNSIDFKEKLPLVRSGQKTQTRIILSGIQMFSKDYDRQWNPHTCPPGGSIPDDWSWWEGPSHGPSIYHLQKINYKKGDELWVREPFFATWGDRFSGGKRISDARIHLSNGLTYVTEQDPVFVYYATDPPRFWNETWRLSTDMDKWASRMTVTVAAVDIRRLQDLDKADVKAEGFATKEAFIADWKATHGEETWDTNPWVIVLDFKV